MQLGDWLDPAAPPDAPWAATTDPHLVATAYRAHVADLLARIAAVLGEESDAAKYAELAEGVRQAFHDEYVTPRGRVVSDIADGVRARAASSACCATLSSVRRAGRAPGRRWCAPRGTTWRPASSAPR